MLTTASEPLIGRISRSLTFNRHTRHFTSGNRQLMPIDIPCQSWQIGLWHWICTSCCAAET